MGHRGAIFQAAENGYNSSLSCTPKEVMNQILEKLVDGDRRSIGRSNEVVADVLKNPAFFESVFDGMLHKDPIIRMRAADAVEKITARHPEYLLLYKQKLIQTVAKSTQQEVRWHVAQMLPRLPLTDEERANAVEILLDYLNDKSKIVKTFAMQALTDFAMRDATLRPQVILVLEDLTGTGSPDMKSWGRKLLATLNHIE
jgi:HEAT repeat protein